MHLTGGQFNGRVITNPKGGRFEVKPTLSKVRESVFNILYSEFGDFSNLSFLDMFAGSGTMSLEALSRGFKEIAAVEYDKETYAQTLKVFKTFNADILFKRGDAFKLIDTFSSFDVIYIDPPWDFDYSEIIKKAYGRLNKNGVLVVESDKKKVKTPHEIEGTEILPFKEKIYGRCVIKIFKKA